VKRRDFIAGLGGAVAWPLAARAQQPAMPVVGYVYGGTAEGGGNQTAGFRKGLSESGFIEGRNVIIEYRYAETDYNRLPEIVADLVRRRVAVIAAVTAPVALAAKSLTTTIPIVFGTGGDPVLLGLATSLNRPEGNLTGFSFITAELTAKRLGLMRELLPGAGRFGLLINPNSPGTSEMAVNDALTAATTLGRQVVVLSAKDGREIDAAFASIKKQQIEALLVNPSTLFLSRRIHVASAAMRYAVPVICPDRQYAEAGGLMSYGPDVVDQLRQMGIYVGRILKGTLPGDLPVVQSTKFQFVINLQTARLLGLDVPPTLLAIADEVIE
jgi:putative tryptophan/tyrosine transport system substrate-binding protein